MTAPVIGMVLAVLGAAGTYLLWTSIALGWRTMRPAPRRRTSAPWSLAAWLAQAGLGRVAPGEFVAVVVAVATLSGVLTFGVFGAALPALVAGSCAGGLPIGIYRARRAALLAEAREAWPRMIEDIRLQTGALGRSIPQALVEVGRTVPEELRPAFEDATRTWLLTTDFAAMIAVLKDGLADATADAACETLLVAHELGGADLDRRLEALLEDRNQDLHGRKDARARQAGVRFARRFVLIVPVGMALAGLSIGTGREAYQTAVGQAAVAGGIVCVVGCWAWAGRLLRLPEEQRVFVS